MHDASPSTLADALAAEALAGSSEATRKIRVRHGVYLERNRPGCHLVRIRLPAGIIAPAQLEAVADLAAAFSKPPRIHLTTRQGLELCGVERSRVVELIDRLAQHGLTTHNTGGNVMRGVVCCARAGAAPDEPFDITPYALAVEEAFRDDPRFQNLPRKIKVAFEGCAEDHVHTSVADIGARAATEKGRRGFRITLGGGLGAAPRLGIPLESFTPAEQLFATVTAVFAFFDANGNRAVRAKARLKWVVEEWGADRVREEILRRRDAAPVPLPALLPAVTDSAPAPAPVADVLPAAAQRWHDTNVRAERDPARVTVGVRIPLGDLQPDGLRALADAARCFAGGVRLTIDQNVALRSVARTSLPALYETLGRAGMIESGEEQLLDITRCAGRTTCLLAITDSRAAARLVEQELASDLAAHPALQGTRIRVSGCANACGHHHWAGIGLFGVVHRTGGGLAPYYALSIGGGTEASPLGRRVADIPARRAGQAVRRVLNAYLEERSEHESFGRFAGRIAPEDWTRRLADLLEPGADPEALFRDVDSDERFSLGAGGPKVAAPAGDC